MSEKLKTNLIPLAIVVAGALIAGAVFFVNEGKTPSLAPQQVGEKAVNFINDNFMQEGMKVSLIDIVEVEGRDLYKFRFAIEEEEYPIPSYITKDGKLLFPEGIELEDFPDAEEDEGAVKSDRPDIKLFVMSYCPYGLQAQKMFLPVYY